MHTQFSAHLENTILNLATVKPFTFLEYTVAVRKTSWLANDAEENTLLTFNRGFYSFADMVIRRNREVGKVTERIYRQNDRTSIPGNCDFVSSLTDISDAYLLDESQGDKDIVAGPVLQNDTSS